MTTDRRLWLIAPPLVVLGWLALLAGVMRIGGAPAALVMLPPPGFAATLPAGVAILSSGPYSLTLKADAAGLVATLYALGAPLVLPAGLTGCLPQTAG